MGVTGRGGLALCAVFVLSVLIGWSDEAQCDKAGNPCDVKLTAMDLTTPAPMTAGVETTIVFSVDLTNDDPDNHVVAASGSNYNLDCVMRYAATDIGKGAPPIGTDPFSAGTIGKKFSSTDCTTSKLGLQSGLYPRQTRTLTGQCTLGALDDKCKDAKYLCLDCEVPTGATFKDAKPTNNIKCDRIDSKLTCDIDLSLEPTTLTDIASLCPATITSGDTTVQTISRVTIKNNNKEVVGSKVNDVRANPGNFKFEYLFSSSDVPVTIVPGTLKSTGDQWGDELKVRNILTKPMSVSITLEHKDCPTATYICLKVSKGFTTTYNELENPATKKYDNYKCCSIAKKICKTNPMAISATINPAVTFDKDVDKDVVLDVVLENEGPGDITEGSVGLEENFEFKQFFAEGNFCANDTLATTPAAPKRCDSSLTLASPSPQSSKLIVGATNTKTFQITCSMKLQAADCKKMKRICVDFKTGSDATYFDIKLSDNCKCTTVDITKVCSPDVEAVSLAEKTAGSVTLKDYVTNQAPLVLNFVIKNAEPISKIPAATGTTANFAATCSMQTATNDKVGTPQEEKPATISSGNENAELNGDGTTEVTLEVTVNFDTLPTADCANVNKVCCTVFAPPPPNYKETTTTNNEQCTAANAVKKNCKPVFKVGSGMETAAGATVTVDEDNAATGALVYTLPGEGPEPTDTLKYKKLSGDVGDYFSLDSDTGKITVEKALDYETITPKSFPIVYEVADQDGANGASSTGTLIINVIDINEKPKITAVAKPDPTTITQKGVTGTTTGPVGPGPGPYHIGVPASYSGSIFEFTFIDEDDDDNNDNANYAWTLTQPTPASGKTDPFITKKNTPAQTYTLEIKPDVINKEGVTQYRVDIRACDNGPPPKGSFLCSNIITIIVDVIPVKEPPTWKQPIPPVTIKENVTAENKSVIILTAIDPDDTDLSFKCHCNPVTDIFKCTPDKPPPPATGKELTIEHKGDPKFDYETTNQYTCYIFAMDGYHVAAMDKVIINIEDVNKPPTMNFPLTPPNVYPVIKVPELHCYGCHLFDYKCTDPDKDQKTTSTFKVYDTPFDLQAKSKFQLDSLDRLLLNFDNNIIYENVNKYLTLFTCCDDATPKKCISQNVTLEVERFNRAPTFNPNTTGITIYEGSGTSDITLNYAAKFKDPEGNAASGCDILGSRYSTFFGITSGKLQRKGNIDYDTYSPPHHFYITIRCSDGGNIARTDEPNVPELKTEMLVEVNVLGLDDNDPVFAPTSYTATLFEDAFSTQSVVTVTATDADLGEHGQLVYQLDPNDPNKVLANELFSIVKLENNEAEIRCRGGLDVEKYSSVIFEVNAVSPGPKSPTDASKRTGTATVTVYIRNVNDLRPQWVTPDYINLEISTTAKVDKLMTTVSCTDADILYNNVNYDQISVTFGGSDYFKTDVYSGEVRSNYTPYEEDERYFVRVVCKDTDPKEDFSGIAIVRIDTYVNWKHVSNWTLCKPMADYKASDQEAFLSSVATLCPPCIPKIHEISEKDGKAVFHLYFIKDNTTYAKNAREYDKVFLETDDILERYYNETLNGPKQSVKDDPVFGGCLVNITRFANEPKDNWFLDTIGGNFMLGFLMSLGFALLVTAVICCARKAAPGRVRIPVTPKGSRPVAPKKVQPKPTTPAPKKQKRPPTPESESDDNLRGKAVLVPPVDPFDPAKIQEAREALVSSIIKRDLDDLEKSIDSVHNKGFAHHLAPELIEAEKVVVQLKRLRQIRGRILDLKQSTVAEIRSYQKPPLPVHTVMTATFLLLGHKEAQTKDWKTVQALVGKTGKESLKRRCIELDASKMDPNAAKRAKSLYGQFDLEEVKLISAGAATFHLWGETMIEEQEAIANARK